MKTVLSLLTGIIFLCNANAQTDEIAVDDIPIATVQDTTILIPQEDDATLLFWHGRRFRLNLGAYFPSNNTQVEVGNKNGNFGSRIDLEDDLGFSKQTSSWTGSLQWRISRRSRLDLEYFYLRREATKSLDRTIEFGENTYPVHASVTAFFDMQIARIAYGYAFVSKPKYEIGALIGAHTIFCDVGLSAETNIGGAAISNDFGFTAPLPDVGIWGDVVISKKIGMYANINYLALEVGDIKGRIVSSNASILYNVYKNFNLTLGYTGLHVRVDVEKERLKGYFKWGYNGPVLTAAYTFGGHVSFQKKRK